MYINHVNLLLLRNGHNMLPVVDLLYIKKILDDLELRNNLSAIMNNLEFFYYILAFGSG